MQYRTVKSRNTFSAGLALLRTGESFRGEAVWWANTFGRQLLTSEAMGKKAWSQEWAKTKETVRE